MHIFGRLGALAWGRRGVAPQSSAIIVMENFSRKDFAISGGNNDGESYRCYLRSGPID